MGYAEAIEQQRATKELYAERGADGLPYNDPEVKYIALMHGLERGDAYYVGPEIARLIDGAAATLPGYTLQAEHLPSSCGWITLGVPMWPLDVEGVGAVHTTALSWAGCVDTEPPFRRFVSLETFADPGVANRPELRPARFCVGGDLWRFGEDRWHSEGMVGDDLDFRAQRWFAAFLLFLKQSILVSSARAVGTRQEIRRLARRDEHVPVVRVVELRRRDYQQRDESQPRDVEYTCQWLVRGHWHQYHTKDGLQPRWVMPYVKGPSDKPLRVVEKVAYEVVR